MSKETHPPEAGREGVACVRAASLCRVNEKRHPGAALLLGGGV